MHRVGSFALPRRQMSLSVARKTQLVGKYATVLPRDSNQALGIAKYAHDFIFHTGKPSKEVVRRTDLFHTDAALCGFSALAYKCRAPTILREEALLNYEDRRSNVSCFASGKGVAPEKAIVANCAAVREWDSNGTVFGYNETLEHTAGEFGHNDFYPVAIAGCQRQGYDGEVAMKAMIAIDEIRGRLAEVFSLKTYKIDHVVHGAIASAAVYGALLGLTLEQIESAIGMTVAHYIPWRAIRHGKQLSDSKGASAALSTEAAIMSVHRALMGFVGPKDIFRNPEAIFCFFEKPEKKGEAPFDIVLSHSGSDFAVMGMHFKLGVYEHQSAGAIHGVVKLLHKHKDLADSEIDKVQITAYEPAFHIIGDPAKRDPKTRQSADHSMVYIVSRVLAKMQQQAGSAPAGETFDDAWKRVMLTPEDYSQVNIFDKETRDIMSKITFVHGGKEFDDRYPEGIPTQVKIDYTTKSGSKKSVDSDLIMFPAGHARNETSDLEDILQSKFEHMASLATTSKSNAAKLVAALSNVQDRSEEEIRKLYNHKIIHRISLD